MSYKFFVTEWQPNGTNDLIITDECYQIVATIDSALFGVRVDFKASELIVADSDQVLEAPWDAEFITAILEGDIHEFCPVIEISAFKAMQHIAVSPVSDGSKAKSLIKKYMRLSA